jgi:glutamate 5-kinase
VPGAPGVLQRLLAGDDVGTVVLPQGEPRALRKRWMLDLKPRGMLVVDAGARTALIERKKSLLPRGVHGVQGEFNAGDLVEIVSPEGPPFARGLSVYSAEEIRRILGCASHEIEAKLGYRLLDCVVHRDDLVVTR